MKNKYFTPDIEDIHVGYECEILKETWEPFKFNVKEIIPVFARVNSKTILSDKIKVPYLTKEQIEAELINDWKFNELTSTFQKKIIRENFILNVDIYYNNFFKKLQIKVIEEHEEFNKLSKTEYNLYNGQCKDINTFRKIIKLLGI